jgi:hypothetical protein
LAIFVVSEKQIGEDLALLWRPRDEGTPYPTAQRMAVVVMVLALGALFSPIARILLHCLNIFTMPLDSSSIMVYIFDTSLFLVFKRSISLFPFLRIRETVIWLKRDGSFSGRLDAWLKHKDCILTVPNGACLQRNWNLAGASSMNY